jgi:hypothetical protein
MASLATTDYASYIITLGGATLFQLKCDASPIENHNTKTLFSIKQNNQGVVSSLFANSFNASHGEKQKLKSMLPLLYDDGEGSMMIWKGVIQRALGIAIPKRALSPASPAYSTEEKKQGILKAIGIKPDIVPEDADRLILKNICAEQTTSDTALIDISGTVLSGADAGGGLQEIIEIVKNTLTNINGELARLQISIEAGANHFHILSGKTRRVAFNNTQAKIVLTFGTPSAPTQVSDRALAWTVAREQGERAAMAESGDGVEQSTGSGSGARNRMSNRQRSSTTNNSGKYVPPALRETKRADTSASRRSKGHGSSTKYVPPALRETKTADTSASWRSKGHGSSGKYVPPARRTTSETKTADTSASWKTVKNKKGKKGKKGKKRWGGRKTRRKRRYSKRKTKRKTRRKTKRKTRRKTIRKKRKTRKR